MSLIESYFNLTSEYSEKYGEKTAVLMMVGSFYEIYGEKIGNNGDNNSYKTITGSKIEDISKVCDLSIAQKTSTFVMAGFTYTKIEKYLKKLQDAGYTCVVINQDPNNPKIRSIEGIYSPGTFFNSDSVEISNNAMCIWVERVSYLKTKSVVIGIANIDIYTGRVIIFEHNAEDKHNPTTYDELERYISTYKPSEIIMITNFSEKILNEVINYAGITCKNIHKVCLSDEVESCKETVNMTGEKRNWANYLIDKAKKCEKQTYRDEVLRSFYKHCVVESFIKSTTSYEYGTQALIFLLNFLNEHNPNLVNKIREPVFDNLSERLILANHSLKQLNIIDDDNYTGKHSSVLKFLNNCITPMGMRKFKYKILNPIFNIDKLNIEYDITDYLLTNGGETQISEWRTTLGELKDIEKLHRQIIHNKVNPRNLFHLYSNLDIISKMYEKLQKDKTIISYLNKELETSTNNTSIKTTKVSDISTMCKNIRRFMESFFDMEKCCTIDNLNYDENFILPNVSKKLDELVYNYKNSYIELKVVQGYFDLLVSSSEKESKTDKKHEYVKIHDTEKMGYSLVCTKRRAKLLEENVKEQIKKLTRAVKDKDPSISVEYTAYNNVKNSLLVELGGISYPLSTGSNCSINSPQIHKICNTIITSKNDMKIEMEVVFKEFIKRIQDEFENEIQQIVDTVTLVDVLQNKAYIVIKNKYCKPCIKNHSIVDIKQSSDSHSDIASSSYVKAHELRHCLIEHINTNEIYVTNDVELGDTTDQNGILLYGTNAVGKTSLIRALGVAVHMAQAGLYVPCSLFEYMPYKSIFTRILGNDNLFKGMSTFMVEMSELRIILKSANNTSLILGDELCSGTEIDSAISIFVAGLKKLHDSNCSFIFATHMHEINKYDEVEELNKLAMKHLEVTYNKETDSLVYDRKLKDGSGFSMYGLEVCKSLHLPDDFLEYANAIRLKYRNGEQSILSLESSKYNSKKIRSMCEICKKEIGTEVHHLQHQKNADGLNFIDHFHKNHVANLASVCEKCHNSIHASGEQHKKVMTTNGSIILKCNKK
jgi:DNA mismatch repair protein MutS